MRRLAVLVCAVVACRGSEPSKKQENPPERAGRASIALLPGDEKAEPAVQADRREFIADVMAFTHQTNEAVVDKLVHNTGMKTEWEAWEGSGAMTDERIKQFYKQTQNYIYDLGGWHLWDLDKRTSDLALVDELRSKGVKSVLDFGGGVGFNSLILAKAGFDVTLADLDSVTLKFAQFRAGQHGVKMKFWKTDIEPMPPDAKYDAILCLDVLEHLPKDVLHETVDKLVKLKHAKTVIDVHAPFGRTAQHPMHLDETEDTKHQVERLQTELPADAKG
jgi:2-polyprenyl-3-methyl-5-hydroxy-6-metoxy-1,4-benzoquinol methylase